MSKRIRIRISISSAIILGNIFICSNVFNATIKGKVIDTQSKLPVAYANIILLNTKLGGMSLHDGSYTVIGIPNGVYSVKASCLGLRQEVVDSIRVGERDKIVLNFQLTYVDTVITMNLTQGESNICDVHKTEMGEVVVFIGQNVHFLWGVEKELYEESKNKNFPNSEPWQFMAKGDPGHPEIHPHLRKAIVLRCRECIKARKAWLDQHEQIKEKVIY